MINKVINKKNVLDKNVCLIKSFSESVHLQCYNMYNKIRTKSIISIKIPIATFAN